jgi:hypothetical protein
MKIIQISTYLKPRTTENCETGAIADVINLADYRARRATTEPDESSGSDVNFDGYEGYLKSMSREALFSELICFHQQYTENPNCIILIKRGIILTDVLSAGAELHELRGLCLSFRHTLASRL